MIRNPSPSRPAADEPGGFAVQGLASRPGPGRDRPGMCEDTGEPHPDAPPTAPVRAVPAERV
ncbi:hypothetical protein ACIF6L_12930 [Kitasatospora sp. NPDC086009]|uniref:hypothetical protein n=1 Tax=unclassified Kitasatospora TaxID=2633591 RepID=UPI0037CB66E0